MFDFSVGKFELASEIAGYATKAARRQRQEMAPSIRVYVTERTDGGWQGLTADGRRVSDMVEYLGYDWTNQWATAERTEDGYVIVGGAAYTGAPPEPEIDGDGG